MCGILLSIQPSHAVAENRNLVGRLCSANSLRGPDACGHARCDVPVAGDGLAVELHAWVLHLRGPSPTHQPIHHAETGNILAFNGEIFGGIHIPKNASDSLLVSEALAQAATEDEVLAALSRLDGEWAIVFYHKVLNRIYFGRDHLGRRSLLIHQPTTETNAFILSSVGVVDALDTQPDVDTDTVWEEVSTRGICVIDLDLANQSWPDSSAFVRTVAWSTDDGDKAGSLISPSLRLNPQIPSPDDLVWLNNNDACVKEPVFPVIPKNSPLACAMNTLEAVLADAVRRRVENIPAPNSPQDARLAILFSGGLDCIVLAALADRFVPPNEPIDLLNVGFENPRVVESKAKEITKSQSHKSRKRNKGTKYVVVDDTGADNEAGGAQKFSTTDLSHEPAIQPDMYDVPDRLTGRLGFSELTQLFPHRHWRLIEINVTYIEAVACRHRISRLMAPLATVMDLSIAMAFWFASRGVGTVVSSDGMRHSHVSAARVLFSGLGADEQLGGYGRHRVQFNKESWPGLIRELQLDVDRIAKRNLGRDDRVISSHGKEVRFPFLDTVVTSTLCGFPVHIKADPRLCKGVGDKLVLRAVAAIKLGLSRAAVEPKRAVQFGARTAKMEDGRQRGQDQL